MTAPQIIGKHAFRDDVPYLVRHPGEGGFVVGSELIVKLDGIREVAKVTWEAARTTSYSAAESGFYAIRIVRKGEQTTHRFADRKVRDWTYQLIVHLIEGTDPKPEEPSHG